MVKLPNVNSKKLIIVLQSFGFALDYSTGSHFIFRNPETGKRATIPYHNKDLPKGTVISILKEAGISKEDFKNFLI